MHPSEYFDYKVPYYREIKEEFPHPKQFSEDFLDKLDKIFLSPRHKWSEVYYNQRWVWDRNEMAQVLYSYIRYAQTYPQQIGHAIDNIIPQITVTMWKRFIWRNKHYRKFVPDRYYKTHVKKLESGIGRLIDDMQKIILEKDYIWHDDDMVKVRKGKGLRESHRDNPYIGEDQLAYYDKLCEDECSGGELAASEYVGG